MRISGLRKELVDLSLYLRSEASLVKIYAMHGCISTRVVLV
jgi:hypothetical protein